MKLLLNELEKLIESSKVIEINGDYIKNENFYLNLEENDDFYFSTSVYDEKKYGDGEIEINFYFSKIKTISEENNTFYLTFEDGKLDDLTIKRIK
jgi:hypothetical protein